jgi:O-antigen ligase
MPSNPLFTLLAIAALPLLVLAGGYAMRRPVVLLAAYAAIVPFGSWLAIPGSQGSFGTLSTLLAIIIMGLLLLHLLLGGERTAEIPAPLPWWTLLVFAAVLTLGWSIAPAQTVDGIAVLISLLLFYVIASLIDVRPADVVVIGTASVVAGAFVGVTALVQLATGTMALEPVTGVPRFALAGGGGEVGDPNITAAGLLLPLSIGAFRIVERGRPRRGRVIYGVAVTLMVGAILLTGSRGGMLGILIVGAVVVFADPTFRPRLAHLVLALLAVGTLVALTPTTVQERLQDSTSTGRTDIWRIGLDACDEYCLTGSGWGTFTEVHARGLLESPDRTGWVFGYEPHNVWLQVLVQAGALAFVLFMGALVVSYRWLLRLPSSWRGPPLAALSALLGSNIFLSNLDFKYFWLTLLYVNLSVTAAGHLVGEQRSTTARHPVPPGAG